MRTITLTTSSLSVMEEIGKTRVEVLENGTISFYARPRVGKDRLESLSDLQRLLIVLASKPSDTSQEHQYRLLIVGRNHLPKIKTHERAWGFVDLSTNAWSRIAPELSEKVYETKTLGKRKQSAAELLAMGIYSIVSHGTHTHLLYRLSQKSENVLLLNKLNIRDEASYILLVKKPYNMPVRGEGIAELGKVEIPSYIWERFERAGFMSCLPASLLDIEELQFTLIGARENVYEELGIAI